MEQAPIGLVEVKTELVPHPPSGPEPAKVSGQKPAKKRSSTASLPAAPAAEGKPTDPKKLFQCPDCQKCVSSARNLKRHESSCKAKKASPLPLA